MKKILYLFLTLALCCTCIIFAEEVYEDETPNTIMYNSDMKISFNGSPIDFKDDQGNELEIFISDGVTYIPAIPVLRLMEKQITSDERDILIKDNNKKLSYVYSFGNVNWTSDTIPLLRLLSHPEKAYNNQFCTEGWLSIENDRIYMYVSKSDYNDKNKNRRVKIKISNDNQSKLSVTTLKPYDGYCAQIYASFNSDKTIENVTGLYIKNFN